MKRNTFAVAIVAAVAALTLFAGSALAQDEALTWGLTAAAPQEWRLCSEGVAGVCLDDEWAAQYAPAYVVERQDPPGPPVETPLVPLGPSEQAPPPPSLGEMLAAAVTALQDALSASGTGQATVDLALEAEAEAQAALAAAEQRVADAVAARDGNHGSVIMAVDGLAEVLVAVREAHTP